MSDERNANIGVNGGCGGPFIGGYASGTSTEVCIKCHLPFSDTRHAVGGTSEARVWKGSLGPFHNQCAIDDPVTIPRAQHDALIAAAKILAKLDTYIDFGEPVTSAVPMLFEDASGINAKFAAAHETLAALRASGIQTRD